MILPPHSMQIRNKSTCVTKTGPSLKLQHLIEVTCVLVLVNKKSTLFHRSSFLTLFFDTPELKHLGELQHVWYVSKSVFSPFRPLCKEGCFLNKNVVQTVFKTTVSFRISNFLKIHHFRKIATIPHQNGLFSRYFSLLFRAHEGCWNIIDFDLHVFLKGFDQMDNLTNSQH